jgi:hypothetical protein
MLHVEFDIQYLSRVILHKQKSLEQQNSCFEFDV